MSHTAPFATSYWSSVSPAGRGPSMSRIPARHSRNSVKSAASSRWSPPRAKGSLSSSLRGSASGNWLILHPPLGRVRVVVVIVLALHRSQFAPLRLLAPLLLDQLVVEPAVDPSRHVGQCARLVIGVALVIDRLIGDCADKPIGGQDAGKLHQRQRRIGGVGGFADHVLDRSSIALVGVALGWPRAVTGQIAAMPLSAIPCLGIARVEPQRYRPVDAGNLLVFRV